MIWKNIKIYDINIVESFKIDVNTFLKTIENQNNEKIKNFWSIFENFFENLHEKNPEMFQETSVKTILMILSLLADNVINNESVMSINEKFFQVINNPVFENIKPILKNNTYNISNLLKNLLSSEKIVLAEKFYEFFLPENKKNIEYLYGEKIDFINWYLNQNKILAFDFLLKNFSGFDKTTIQAEFIKNNLIQEKYLNVIFPNHMIPKDFQNSFMFDYIFKNSNILLIDKIKFLNYFNNPQNFSAEVLLFIFDNIENEKILPNQIKMLDIKDENIRKQILFQYFEKTKPKKESYGFYYDKQSDKDKNTKWFNDIQKNIQYFFEKDQVNDIILEFLTTNKENDFFMMEFIQKNKENILENPQKFIKILMNSNNISEDTILYAFNLLDISHEDMNENLKKIIKEKKYYSVYLSLYKNQKIDNEWIDNLYNYFLNTNQIPESLENRLSEFKDLFLKNLIKNQTSENIFSLLFRNGRLKPQVLKDLVCNSSLKIYMELLNDKKSFEYFVKNTNIELFINKEEVQEILKENKWSKIFKNKKMPTYLLYENNHISIIYDHNFMTKIQNESLLIQEQENNSENIVDKTIEKSKKDFIEFGKLIHQDIPFDLNFKIRAEHLFLQQIDFLKELKKTEELIDTENIYLLQNNLGKYLLQCIHSYGKALQKNEIAQKHNIEDKEEKIHAEALKQIALLEKEFELVKKNIINNITDIDLTEMKVNTRVLETKNEQIENTPLYDEINKQFKIG